MGNRRTPRRRRHPIWIAVAVQIAMVLPAVTLIPLDDVVSVLVGDDDADTNEGALAPLPQMAEEELEAVLPAPSSLLAGNVFCTDHFHLHLAPRDGHRSELDRPPQA